MRDIEKILLQEDQATEAFRPEHAQPHSNLKTEEHYTLIAPLPEELSEEVQSRLTQLKMRDAALLDTPASNLHMTIQPFPLGIDVDWLKTATRDVFPQGGLEVWARGLHVRPSGISVGLYAEQLPQLRLALSERFDIPTSYRYHGLRHDIGWIALARFSQPPTREVVRYIQDNVTEEFGTFTFNTLALYYNTHRTMEEATREWELSRT